MISFDVVKKEKNVDIYQFENEKLIPFTRKQQTHKLKKKTNYKYNVN